MCRRSEVPATYVDISAVFQQNFNNIHVASGGCDTERRPDPAPEIILVRVVFEQAADSVCGARKSCKVQRRRKTFGWRADSTTGLE
jgi:hypothetical protein